MSGDPVTLETVEAEPVHENQGFLSTSEQQAQRLEACNTCEKRFGFACTMCGCVVALKVKVANSLCPLGRWET